MSNNNNNSFLGFLTGIIIGGILGVLFAPRKGSETREALMDVLDDVKEKGVETYSKTKQSLSEIYKDGKNFIVEEKNKIIDDVEEIASDVKSYKILKNNKSSKK